MRATFCDKVVQRNLCHALATADSANELHQLQQRLHAFSFAASALTDVLVCRKRLLADIKLTMN